MSQANPSSPLSLRQKGRIMSASEIERTLVRLAHEIIEKNNGGHNLGLVGIKRRGVPLAERLAALIGGDLGPRLLPMGSLAGLLWLDLLRREGTKISIAQFILVGLPVTIPTLALSLFILVLGIGGF